jgi:pilus assembly protein CpaE
MRILSHMRRMFDFIIIDGGHSVSDIGMKTLENSNRVFLVSLLSLPCLTNTSKLLGSFATWGFPARQNTHIVINRYIHNSEISIEDCEQSISRKVFWKIPNDYALTMSAINQGLPLCEVDAKAEVTKCFSALAQELMQPESAHAAGQGKLLKKLPIFKSIFGGPK